MGRRRRSKRKPHKPPDPVDVLEGRVEIRAEELFDLIHRINPTGRELPRAEETRRYELKGRLQSLLIRRFGDRHLVVTPGGHDGIVSLGHRSGARDACHAVLSELAPDSRSWVQRQLDVVASTGAGEAAEAAVTSRVDSQRWGRTKALGEDEDLGAEEHLQHGRKALEDYDYEAAERHLRLALENSNGGAEAARALLELLVDLLGMDSQALAVEPRLSARARADHRVRVLLARAAARLGDGERALELAAGAAGPEVAEVHVALAARAIQARDSEAASRHLETTRKHDPTHPRLPSLTEEVAELQAESQRPAEEALEQRCREAGPLAAEDDARALLARWPESEVARRILRDVAAQRRAEEIARHLEQGEQALAEDRFHQAATELQAALDAGSERPDLPALIERARVGQRRQQETSRVDAAAGRFSTGDLKHALLGYLALPGALRKRVKESVDQPALGWLEEIVARDRHARSGARAQAAVSAVLALELALDELDSGRPQAALDRLSPHGDVVRDVADARKCLREAQSRIATERRARASETLQAARAAFEEARLERARELLEPVDLEDLAAGERPAVEDLLAAIRHSETAGRLERELERHLESEDHLGALERSRQLLEEAQDRGERQRWQRRTGELRSQIREAWRIKAVGGEAPLEDLRDLQLDALDDTPRYWLDDDGRELVLATAWADRLFIRVVDVVRGCVVSRVSLKTPEPLGDSLEVCRDGDRLWVAGPDGYVLELETGTWDVLSWRSLRELLAEEMIIEDVILLPGGLFIWLRVRLPSNEWQIRVVDVRAWRVSRKLAERSHLLPVAGPGEPRVAISGFRHGTRLHTARGAPESTEALIGCYIHAAAIGPDEEGLVIAIEQPPVDDDPNVDWTLAADDSVFDLAEDDEPCLALLLAADSRRGVATDITAGVRLTDAFLDGANAVATSLDEGLSYALVQYGETERELLILSTAEKTFEVLQQKGVPFETVLAQDRRSRYVVALMDGERFFDVVPLGSGQPRVTAVPEPRQRLDRILPFVHRLSFCGSPTGASNAHALALVGSWRDMSALDLRRHLKAREAKHAGDPDRLVSLCLALEKRDDLEAERQRIIRRLAQQHPRHGGAALLLADLEAKADNWQEVARVLGQADVSDLEDDDGRTSHFHHLLGLALLRDGRTDEAYETFEQGLAFDREGCMLRLLVHLTRPMSDPPEAHEHSPDQPVVRQLLGAMRLADRALAAGDPATALAAIDRRAVWHQAEVQSAARLAAAYLELSASDPGERYRKRLALALFQDVFKARKQALVEISLPGLSWDEERLTEVANRALSWLASTGEPDRSVRPAAGGARR